MEKIIVGFSKPKNFKLFAYLIMKLFDTPYDHVYMKFHSTSYDRDIIYQASKMMVNFMGSKVFEDDNIIFKEFNVDISSETKKSLMVFCIDNAGKPYSIKEALGLGLVKLLSIIKINIANPFKDEEDDYVCSVLVTNILKNFTTLNIEVDPKEANPKTIYDILEGIYGKN